ncbi:hypothetical protein F4802DRAFT_618533 [Xylaria palmicola]|nr:hypothetical protein F4802DRAFT_618533 [Xylaria palmicola]
MSGSGRGPANGGHARGIVGDGLLEAQDDVSLWVGVETEAPLAVTRRNEATEEKELLQGVYALRELAKLLNDRGLPAYDSPTGWEEDYTRWCITFDSSIEKGRELAVHVSLGDGPLPLRVAQKLAFCVIYFEQAINDVMPGGLPASDNKRPGGWKNCAYFARRNRVRPASHYWQPLDGLPGCWAAIRGTSDITELHNLMCFDDDNYRRISGREHKYWKWNFKGLKYLTIEFRQMPPCRSVDETRDWIIFTTEFIKAAARVNRGKLNAALSGDISFTEALGLELAIPRRHLQDIEERWAEDGYMTPLNIKDLRSFMACPDAFWERLVAIRDRIESELLEDSIKDLSIQ